MGQHLGCIHLPPNGFTIVAELINAADDGVVFCFIKKTLHCTKAGKMWKMVIKIKRFPRFMIPFFIFRMPELIYKIRLIQRCGAFAYNLIFAALKAIVYFQQVIGGNKKSKSTHS